MRWLVQFGYDGTGFDGWARQPGHRTIEGTIRDALVGRGAAVDLPSARLEVASRTDRGVSARANALALTSPRTGPALLRCLNGIDPTLWFRAATPVAEPFRVRSADRRVYRYLEPAAGHDIRAWREAAELFRGSVDVRSFGRGLPAHSPARRAIEKVTVDDSSDPWVIELRAPSFVWGEVRKIVASLRAVDAGRLELPELVRALRGETRLTLPMAEPERLLLWEVAYPLAWAHRWPGPNRRQEQFFRAERAGARVRDRMLSYLDPAAARSDGRD